MTCTLREITTDDGRTLEVATLGDPAGPTVFFHHGTPGSAPLADFFADLGNEAGFFIVSMSRAGYGTSTRLEGRSVASVVTDVERVLDQLGRDRYLSVGWSGGGPHALACAALDAPRCRAAWSLAGVVPTDVDFDWTEGMGPENLEEFALAIEGGPRYFEHMLETGRLFATASPENIVELFGGLLSDVDKTALADDALRATFATGVRHAFAGGADGFIDDDRAFFSPWGFEPQDIEVPVEVWYGDHDLMVPASHGAWLGHHIPGATVVHLPAEGHVSLFANHVDELGAAFARALSR
jgi:pimeloyl-ACP methyl ester carboxylesterase